MSEWNVYGLKLSEREIEKTLDTWKELNGGEDVKIIDEKTVSTFDTPSIAISWAFRKGSNVVVVVKK